jgi:hypothetical protein
MAAIHMNLRNTTLLLLLGSVYTVLHKAAFALFPALGSSALGRTIMTILWIVATSALMLFAYRFLIELSPRDRRMRAALVSIIVFTGLIILSKLPLGIWADNPLARRLVFGLSSQRQ